MSIVLGASAVKDLSLYRGLIDLCGRGLNLIFLFRDIDRLTAFRRNSPQITSGLYPSLIRTSASSDAGIEAGIDVASLVQELHSDSLSLPLFFRAYDHVGYHAGYSEITLAFLNSIGYLRKHNVSTVVFCAPPHHFDPWILGRAAQFLNLPVYFINFSVFKNCFFLMRGMPGLSGDNSCEPLKISEISGNESASARSYDLVNNLGLIFERARRDGDLATPPSEIKRQVRSRKIKKIRGSRVFGLAYFLRDRVNEFRLRAEYNRLSKKAEIHERFAIFFLHVQPERSTLPEGGKFSDQLLAITAFRNICPIDCTVYVREHPSSFLGPVDVRFRDEGFYRRIDALNGVELISSHYSSYDLIDRALVVGTVTGKVAYEAAARGTPSIIFGEGKYVGPIELLGVFRAEPNTLLSDIEGALSKRNYPAYINWVSKYAFGHWMLYAEKRAPPSDIRGALIVKILVTFLSRKL